jgi:hypothetical protein
MDQIHWLILINLPKDIITPGYRQLKKASGSGPFIDKVNSPQWKVRRVKSIYCSFCLFSFIACGRLLL